MKSVWSDETGRIINKVNKISSCVQSPFEKKKILKNLENIFKIKEKFKKNFKNKITNSLVSNLEK